MLHNENPKQGEQLLPQEVKTLFDKGVFAYGKKNYDYAIELFTNTLKLKFDFAQARHYLRLAEQNKYKDNPRSIASVLAFKLIHILLLIKASIFYLQHSMRRSVEVYEKILRKEPFNEKVLFRLGKVFMKMDDVPSALKTFEEIVQINPKNEVALKRLGEMYLRSEEYQKARSCFKAAQSLSPRDLEAEKFLRDLDALGVLKDNLPK